MITKRVLTVFALSMIVLFVLAPMTSAQDEDITLTILTHWGDQRTLAGQQAYLDEYTALHPNVKFELITVPFEELYTKITTLRTAGESPDIYHMYNLWLPEFVTSGMMSTPPQSLVDSVVANTSPGVVEGTTFDGQVWGYPTEVNTYLLLYNKRLLAEAGYTEPPANWEELVEIASAITKTDDTGAVNQVGFAVITGWIRALFIRLRRCCSRMAVTISARITKPLPSAAKPGWKPCSSTRICWTATAWI